MDQISNHHYLLILCGGTGPRLWPLSRADNPKQFLTIVGNTSLLQQTLSRAKYSLPSNHIFLITNQKYLDQVKKHLGGDFPSEQIISEPIKKNTAMAIIYGVSVISQIDPDAIITALPSDQFISPLYLFRRQLTESAKLASAYQAIVTIGIKPEYPNPSYGYITPVETKQKYFHVKQFIEKPDVKTAELLISKNSYWNSGIYTFSVKTLLAELHQHCPDYSKFFQKLANNSHQASFVRQIYQLSPNLPFDIALSQKSSNLIMIPAKFKWNDLGEWGTIFNQLKNSPGNVIKLNSQTIFESFDSQSCLVSGYPNKLIGLVGVQNLAVIDTPDGLLICNLNQSPNVRNLVTQIINSKTKRRFFLKSNHDQK